MLVMSNKKRKETPGNKTWGLWVGRTLSISLKNVPVNPLPKIP